jgi:hypothetical protein
VSSLDPEGFWWKTVNTFVEEKVSIQPSPPDDPLKDPAGGGDTETVFS